MSLPGRSDESESRRIMRVGLTGGIASGKTTVAKMFAGHGVPIIDTDDLAREVVMQGQPALRAIAAAFGPAVIQPDGSLDRRALRAIVFEDEVRRRQLEQILHPRIEAAALEACEHVDGPYLLLVVPLLIESGFDRLADRVLVVDCPPELQRARLMDRDGETAEQANLIIAAQTSRAARLAHADDVIHNTGDLTDTRLEVDRLHAKYTAMGRQFKP